MVEHLTRNEKVVGSIPTISSKAPPFWRGFCYIRANRQQHTGSPQPSKPATPTTIRYRVRITTKELRIRKGPGTNYPIAQNAIAPGVYTIVAESKGTGSTKGWGKLKSGAGWISLDFATKL